MEAANTAQPLRDAGKYIESRARLVVCSSDACPAVVNKSCQKWLAQIDAELPTVIFSVKDSQGRDRADVRVFVDNAGAPALDRLLGTPVPMDPGEHAVRFEVAGLPAREDHIVLRAGEKNRRIDITLSAPMASSSPPSSPAAPKEAEGSNPASSSTMRNVMGIGLAALAVGSAAGGFYFAAQSSHQSDEAASLRQQVGSPSGCAGVTTTTCNQLSDAVSAQHRDANVSTALFVAAVGLALSSAAVWLFWPNHAAKQPRSIAWILP